MFIHKVSLFMLQRVLNELYEWVSNCLWLFFKNHAWLKIDSHVAKNTTCISAISIFLLFFFIIPRNSRFIFIYIHSNSHKSAQKTYFLSVFVTLLLYRYCLIRNLTKSKLSDYYLQVLWLLSTDGALAQQQWLLC